MEGPHFPLMSELRDRLRPVLVDATHGAVLTYEQLTVTLGVDAHDRRARTAIWQVANELLREHRKAVENVRTVGYRVVRANEHVRLSRGQQQRASRRLRRAVQVVVHVDYADLTPDERNTVLNEQARTAMKFAVDRALSRTKTLPAPVEAPTARDILRIFRKPA